MKRVLMSVCALTLTTTAQADVWSDPSAFLTANPGLDLIDFEGIAPPGDFTDAFDFNPQGVSFVSGFSPDQPFILSATATSLQFGMSAAPSDFIVQGFDDVPLGVVFSGEVTAVGFNVVSFAFGNDFTPFDVVVEAFNGQSLLASVQLTPELLASFGSYVGFSDLGSSITSVRISPTDQAARVVGIDNLSFGAPVPSPATPVLIGGAVGAGLFRRRRSR